MPKPARIAEPEMIGAINVTPFIDVMLVLLIVMILSMPVMTHKVAVDLPSGAGPALEQTTHLLSIDRQGALFWDGAAISDAALPAMLERLQGDDAVLHLQTDPQARYERFDSILAVVKRANIGKLGFVGNEPLTD